MTEKQFCSMVEAKAPPGVSPDALTWAKRGILNGTDNFSHEDVRKCIEWAGIITEALKKQAGEEGQTFSRPLFTFTPHRSLSSAERAEAIRPWVEQVRTEIFGSPKVPFPSYEKALEWINATDKGTPPLSEEERKRVRELREEIQEKGFILESLTGKRVNISSEETTFRYPKDGWQRLLGGFSGWRNPALRKLTAASREMATATNFSQLLLVAHILSGIPLLLPPAEISTHNCSASLPTGGGLRFSSVVVRFPSLQDVTPEELQALYHTLRKEAGLTKMKKFSESDLRLQEIVSRLDGVPRAGKGKFWERVRSEYNKKTPRGQKRWTDGNAARMAYERLQKRLSLRSSRRTGVRAERVEG